MPWHTMPKQGLSCVLFICWITLAHCTTCVYKSYCDPGCTGYPSCTGYNSNYGATNCYYCKPCGIGQFKPWDARRPDRTSNDQCYYCGTNLFTFFEGSTKESDCVCGPGVAPYGVPYYYGISWEIFCYRCGYGTYKDEIGMTPCKSCPAGKYAGGTMNTQCTLCPANTYSTTVAARYSTGQVLGCDRSEHRCYVPELLGRQLCRNARQLRLLTVSFGQVLKCYSSEHLYYLSGLLGGQVLGCHRSEHRCYLSKLRCRQLCSNASELCLLTVSFEHVLGCDRSYYLSELRAGKILSCW